MKNLIILILLFMFSCTQVERVGNERVYLDRDEAAEPTEQTEVKSVEKTETPVEKITPVKEEKLKYAPDYVSPEKTDMSQLDSWINDRTLRYLTPDSGDGHVIKLVAFLKPNAYGIKKAWYSMTKHNNGKLLDDDRVCTIKIKIETVGSSMDTFEDQFVQEGTATGLQEIEALDAEYTALIEQKFLEILKLIIESNNE